MNLKKIIFFSMFFVFYYSNAQDYTNNLPFKEIPKYSSKKNNQGVVLAKMVNELGYKYYWATDSLLNDELKKSYTSTNLPRLLLNEVYYMSENLINSISNKKEDKKIQPKVLVFEDIRKHTLLNLKETSNLLIKNKDAFSLLNWNLFMKSISIADSYLDQIILFRKNSGKPYKLNQNVVKKHISMSKKFESNKGADGISDAQWMKIMKRGGGIGAWDTVRKRNRQNNIVFFKLKRIEYAKAKVEAGKLENLEKYSNSVEGVIYTYFREPPKQLSFLYSNDNELVKGLIDWIIYINSGNPVKLSDIFRVGLDIGITLNNSQNKLAEYNSYRDITDEDGNEIRLEFPKKYFDSRKFSDEVIKEVYVKTANPVSFIGEDLKKEHTDEKVLPSIILLKNIKGSLLVRIKKIIELTRDGTKDYDDNLLNLRKY